MPGPHTTVTSALDEIGFGRFQRWLLCYGGLCWLADACETMILSFLGPAVACAWGVGAAAESALTSVVFVGMLSGVYSLGVLSDHLGRRRGFLLSALLLGAAGLASALAPSFGWLLLARAVVGFALGGTPVAVTLFAEFCPTAGRGRWLLAMQLFWTIGTMLEVLLAWAVLGTLGWRWLLALSAAPLALLLLLYPLLPESPHWLVSQRRYAEAEAVLRRVAAVNAARQTLLLQLDPDGRDPAPPAGSNGWQHAAGGDGDGGMRSRSPARRPAGGQGAERQRQGSPGPQRPPSLLRTVLAAFRVVLGPQLRRTSLLLYAIWNVNAVVYYGLVLLTTALQTAAKKEECTPAGAPNFDSRDYLAILVTTLAEAPGLLAAGVLIDSQGRKWTLRVGLATCAAALASLVADPPSGGQLALLFLARACIEGTFSCLYVYSPELYPTAVRSVGLALCNGFSRLGGFLAPFATVYLVAGGRTHAAEALLGALCGAATACAFFLPFETRGRDLQSAELVPDAKPCSAGKERGVSSGGAAAQAGAGLEGGEGHLGRQAADGELELEPTHEHDDETGPLLRS